MPEYAEFIVMRCWREDGQDVWEIVGEADDAIAAYKVATGRRDSGAYRQPSQFMIYQRTVVVPDADS